MNMEFDLVISEPDYGLPTYLDEFQNEILTLDELWLECYIIWRK